MPDDKLYSVNGERPHVKKSGRMAWKDVAICVVVAGGRIGPVWWAKGTMPHINESDLQEIDDAESE